MKITELESILTNAIGYDVGDLRTIANKRAKESKDLFDPVLYTYRGLAKIQDAFEISWSLTQDEGYDWFVSYEDVKS